MVALHFMHVPAFAIEHVSNRIYMAVYIQTARKVTAGRICIRDGKLAIVAHGTVIRFGPNLSYSCSAYVDISFTILGTWFLSSCTNL
jgi:hypothetical protein